jgi:hypothetical protein
MKDNAFLGPERIGILEEEEFVLAVLPCREGVCFLDLLGILLHLEVTLGVAFEIVRIMLGFLDKSPYAASELADLETAVLDIAEVVLLREEEDLERRDAGLEYP